MKKDPNGRLLYIGLHWGLSPQNKKLKGPAIKLRTYDLEVGLLITMPAISVRILPPAKAPKLVATMSSKPRPDFTRMPPAIPPAIPRPNFIHQGSGGPGGDGGKGQGRGGGVPHQPTNDQ